MPAVGSTSRTAADLADSALTQVGADPRRAEASAQEAISAARLERDRGAESKALRAQGLARKEMGDLPEALTALRAAVRVGERGGLPEAAAEARMSLAFVLMDRGHVAAALKQADRAAGALRGVAGARVLAQRALIHQRCGRLEDALEDYRRALAVLQRAGDRAWEARLRNNRGLLHAYRGSLRAAETDLRRALSLFESLGLTLEAADATWNIGFLAARRGDVPGALERYDRTELIYARNGVPVPELLVDRAEVLLTAGLAEEASAAADAAVEQLTLLERDTDLAEAQLLRAQSALAAGHAELAAAAADDAARRFRRQSRPGWTSVAQYVSLRATAAHGEPDLASVCSRADRLAGALQRKGWRVLAMDCRLLAAQAALSMGRLDDAESHLRRTTAARQRGSVDMQVRAWHAEALLRLASGRRSAVEPALRAGLRALDKHRGSLGATELRVHAASYGSELARMGLVLALEDGDAARALSWTEQWRAGTLRLSPVRPPSDSSLAASLAELRHVSAGLEEALLDGLPSARLRSRQAKLEREIQAASRRSAGTSKDPREPAVEADELLAQLGSRALVSYFAVDGTLHALTLVADSVLLHRLGSSAEAAATLEMLHFSLRRLAAKAGSPASLAAARAAAGRGAQQLDDLLLEPLRSRLDDRALVLLPTAALHGVPWGLLPTSARVPTVVAPSGTVWRRADALPPAGTAGSGLLVAGPRLPWAELEVSALTTTYPSARCLSGRDATVERVSAALEAAEWAHLATHGSLRADNPLFSALELADGSLTVYDLERLAHVPRLVALPACQSGVGSVHAGEEVLGLATALLALGTRTLLATVIPVPDSASGTLMVAVHDRLSAGDAAPVALGRARVALDPDDAAGFAAAAGFVCLGAG